MSALQGFTPWPRQWASQYRAAGYWSGERLDRLATTHLSPSAGSGGQSQVSAPAEALAIIDDAGSLTYHQLEFAIRLVGTALRAAGIRSRDRVVLHLGNCTGFVVVALALMRIGAIPVYSLPAHGQRELTGVSSGAEAVAIVTSGANQEAYRRARSVLAEVPSLAQVLLVEELMPAETSTEELPDDPVAEVDTGEVAFLQLSGGTTGTPKLIPRTHDDYHYSIRRSVEICGVTAWDTMLILLPAAHNFPMSSPGFLGMLHAGGAVVLAGTRAPRQVFELIARTSTSIIPLVPPLALTLVNAAERGGADITPLLESLRIVQVGGAKLAPELAARMGPALGCRVQQVFGMAEGLVCYTDPEDTSERVLRVQGRPMSEADEVRVVGPDGTPVSDGEPGDLQTRGPYTIRGYWRNSQANASSFTQDGFYCTGDVVVRDAQGYLTVHGRSKDHINRGGEKISAEEVENLLLKHPGVDDAIVIGIPDAYLGEKAVGVILPHRQGLTEQELSAHMENLQVESLKIPDRFTFRSSFPTTGVGKISRADLRTALREQLTREGDQR